MKTPKKYLLLSSEVLHGNPLFQILAEEKQHPAGKKGRFIRVHAPDWVTVIPLRMVGTELEILMIHQYRHGSDSLVWEFPGGVMEAGESPTTAGLRELKEETGAECGGQTPPRYREP
jgi:ADP-ribose pyrophosphatase